MFRSSEHCLVKIHEFCLYTFTTGIVQCLALGTKFDLNRGHCNDKDASPFYTRDPDLVDDVTVHRTWHCGLHKLRMQKHVH